MYYFSEIFHKKIVTEDNVLVGKLEDLIFLASENPYITKFVIKFNSGKKEIVPIKYLKKINDKIVIDKNYLIGNLEENELYLLKNLLDKQIIDIKGNKIVRVNDISIGYIKNKYLVLGVDIGILGIIRRLRFLGGDFLYKLMRFFKIKITSDFLSWADIQPLELMRGKVKLRKKEEKLERIRPEDLADYLERTNIKNTKKFLKILDIEEAAEVLSNFNFNYQTALFKTFKPETAAKFVSYMEADEAVDLLLTLNQKKREEIINLLSGKIKENILKLLNLPQTEIGGLVSTEFITVQPDDTVIEVINKIKKEAANFSYLQDVYVVNKNNELIGVFNLHELLIQDSETPVYKFMIENVIVIHLTTPIEIALKKMLKYKIYTLPVINFKKQIEGVLSLDDLNLEDKL